MTDPKEKTEIINDGAIQIATGRSRKDIAWKNQETTWSKVVQKLSTTTRTRESSSAYQRMNTNDRAEIKDVGGFVAGMLKGGRRKTGQVAWRSMITLDADYALEGLWDDLTALFECSMVMYSTHSHTTENPRFRVVVPLARALSPDEYKAVSRFFAAEIGIDIFDDSTYEVERLMYWPSTSEDGEYIFKHQDGPWLDPDSILARHPAWRDISTWPESSRAGYVRKKHAEKQGDSREKPGIVGAFCRAYTVTEAIDNFLMGIYLPCDMSNRYTYADGSTAAGMVIYDDDLFAYSHHGTDPAGGQLCNAFDLVRIHKYSAQDEDVKPDTPINKYPSFQAMQAWAVEDPGVKTELSLSKNAEAQEDFKKEDQTWRSALSYNADKGTIQQTIDNAVIVMRNDPHLKGLLVFDDFNRRALCKPGLPWSDSAKTEFWEDADEASLRHYLEKFYGLKNKSNQQDALAIVFKENAFHPVIEYLDGLIWDGVPRLDSLLIDMLGADDEPYTRAVTRKWVTAAVARVREPGCKFDYMLILVGSQGMGKSQFFNRLAVKQAWFSDSLGKLDNSKESMEHIAGKWILEIGELSGMKKADIESIKTFLTKQEDSYRPSYGRNLTTFPRQCVFAGTTNRDDFLQDATGNRRYWPVQVNDNTRFWAEMNKGYVDQLWAEADMYYMLGEDLYLSNAEENEARAKQETFTESGGKLGQAEEFLNRLIPADWDDRYIKEKINWLQGFDLGTPEAGTQERESISGLELYVECFNGRPEYYTKQDAYEMSDILKRLGWKRCDAKQRKRLKDYGRQRQFNK